MKNEEFATAQKVTVSIYGQAKRGGSESKNEETLSVIEYQVKPLLSIERELAIT